MIRRWWLRLTDSPLLCLVLGHEPLFSARDGRLRCQCRRCLKVTVGWGVPDAILARKRAREGR